MNNFHRQVVQFIIVIVLSAIVGFDAGYVTGVHEQLNKSFLYEPIKDTQISSSKHSEDSKSPDPQPTPQPDPPQPQLVNMGYYETGNSIKKPYEDYRCITDTTSQSYQFLNSGNVQINSEGYLVADGEYYCIALGQYFGTIGDRFEITLDNGFKFKCVIGDRKQQADTDAQNYAGLDGHIIEFIIDSSSSYMQQVNIKYHGLVNNVDEKFNGNIVSIYKIS